MEHAIAAAIAAGQKVKGQTGPNPPVGCVLLNAAGDIIATGSTAPVGGAHAEVAALQVAGARARGATAVVTLEPCNHTGRTGPCSHALVDAGVSKVVYLTSDPNPVAAGGAQYLREHGVEVELRATPVDALVPWLHAVQTKRPFVTLKIAQTLDGFSAAVDGTSKWITGTQARRYVHADRITRDAIIIGTGTAIADNPSLTARTDQGDLIPGAQPTRVVIGTRDVSQHAHNLSELGYQQFPGMELALASLFEAGCYDVLVEGGAHLVGSFLQAGLADALAVYIAPKLLGGGQEVAQMQPVPTISYAHEFNLTGIKQLGEDVLINYRKQNLRV